MDNNENTSKSSLGIDANISALLAYLFLAFGGILFYVLEKENKQVRFAAMQSIMLSVAFGAALILATSLGSLLATVSDLASLLVGFLVAAIFIGFFVVWIRIMIKAFNGEDWELPIIGQIARGAIK
jgi:uncharacterized membrane protein